jgi:hypothetical protein
VQNRRNGAELTCSLLGEIKLGWQLLLLGLYIKKQIDQHILAQEGRLRATDKHG